MLRNKIQHFSLKSGGRNIRNDQNKINGRWKDLLSLNIHKWSYKDNERNVKIYSDNLSRSFDIMLNIKKMYKHQVNIILSNNKKGSWEVNTHSYVTSLVSCITLEKEIFMKDTRLINKVVMTTEDSRVW